MLVNLSRVSKKRNSTYSTPGGGHTYNCKLKAGCSIEHPVIELQWDGSSSPVSNNYAIIQDFGGRHYWIDNWTYNDRLWTASMSVDVLRTYKNEIGQATKYILRSASDYDLDVIDTLYPAKAELHKTIAPNIGPQWPQNYGGGSYVVGITGQGNTYSSGGVGYVVCTSAVFDALLNSAYTGAAALWPTSTGGTIGEALAGFGDNLQKSMTQPYQFINSVLWLPYTPTLSGTTPVTLGTFNTGISAGTLNNTTEQINFSVALNTEPAGAGEPAWKNLAPFVRYVVEYPPFGTFDVDPETVRGASSLIFHIVVENTTGNAYLYVNAGSSAGPCVINAPGMLGINMVANGIMTNTVGAVGGVLKAVGSAALGVASAGASTAMTGSGIVSGIGDAIKNALPQAISGGNPGGGIAGLNGQRRVTTLWFDPVDETIAEKGRPLCKEKQISSLSGYVLCMDGDIEIPGATETELREIEAFLTGGFYYE